jgi:hypothetical protein
MARLGTATLEAALTIKDAVVQALKALGGVELQV